MAIEVVKTPAQNFGKPSMTEAASSCIRYCDIVKKELPGWAALLLSLILRFSSGCYKVNRLQVPGSDRTLRF